MGRIFHLRSASAFGPSTFRRPVGSDCHPTQPCGGNSIYRLLQSKLAQPQRHGRNGPDGVCRVRGADLGIVGCLMTSLTSGHQTRISQSRPGDKQSEISPGMSK